MDIRLFEQFKHAHLIGRKKEAADAVNQFVASFASSIEKAKWTKWYLENESFGHKIRHELYESVIFPSLLSGYQSADPWSLRWLIRTRKNLRSSQKLWQQIGLKTEHELLLELVAICPDDDDARTQLLERKVDGFRYSVHEWPAGILYGCDGANVEQCNEILNDIAHARKLDLKHEYSEFLSGFESKVLEYRERRGRHRAAEGKVVADQELAVGFPNDVK